MTIDERPPRDAVLATGGVAAVVVLAVALVPQALPVAIAGSVVVVLGTARGSRAVLGVGVLLQFGAVLVAGIASLPAGPLLVGLVAGVLSWDVGEQSISVTEQLGREARLRRPIAVHGAASILVGAIAISGVYAMYLVATGNQPLPALVLFLGGAGLVLLAMRV